MSGDGVEDVQFLLSARSWRGWRKSGGVGGFGRHEGLEGPGAAGATLRDCRMRVVGLVGGKAVAEDASDATFALGPLDVNFPELGAY